jgi:hypothetical protein
MGKKTSVTKLNREWVDCGLVPRPTLLLKRGTPIAYKPSEVRELLMMVAGGLGILVVLCLLLSMVEKPPAVGR